MFDECSNLPFQVRTTEMENKQAEGLYIWLCRTALYFRMRTWPSSRTRPLLQPTKNDAGGKQTARLTEWQSAITTKPYLMFVMAEASQVGTMIENEKFVSLGDGNVAGAIEPVRISQKYGFYLAMSGLKSGRQLCNAKPASRENCNHPPQQTNLPTTKHNDVLMGRLIASEERNQYRV